MYLSSVCVARKSQGRGKVSRGTGIDSFVLPDLPRKNSEQEQAHREIQMLYIANKTKIS